MFEKKKTTRKPPGKPNQTQPNNNDEEKVPKPPEPTNENSQPDNLTDKPGKVKPPNDLNKRPDKQLEEIDEIIEVVEDTFEEQLPREDVDKVVVTLEKLKKSLTKQKVAI